MSWVWKIGNCFFGCASESPNDESRLIRVAKNGCQQNNGNNVQMDRRKVLQPSEVSQQSQPRHAYQRQVSCDSITTSVSCSGYQTFGCGSSYEGDDSDDERSVDFRGTFRSKLNRIEEGPSNSDEIDQVWTQIDVLIFQAITFTGRRGLSSRNNPLPGLLCGSKEANCLRDQLS